MQVKYKITLAPKFKAFQQRYFKLNAGHRHERTIFYRITYGCAYSGTTLEEQI